MLPCHRSQRPAVAGLAETGARLHGHVHASSRRPSRCSCASPSLSCSVDFKTPRRRRREAFALLDDSHPIMPSQLVASSKALKEKQKRSKGKVTWTYEEFRNSARADDEKWRMKR